MTAGILALTILCAATEVAFVRPCLPAGSTPNLARPPAPAGASDGRD